MLKSRLAWCLIAALLIIAAANIYDPYVAPIRTWLLPLLHVAAIAGLLCAWRLRSESALPLLLAAAISVTLMIAEVNFLDRKSRVLSIPPRPASVMLGRHFIVGYRDVSEVEALADKGLIGGIYVTGRNIAGRGADALRDEIASLQARRRAAGLPPLIVATDQEGGVVAHLSPPLSRWPSLADLATMPPLLRRARASAEGIGMGLELAAIGVNVDFAPVVDLRPAGGHHRFDFNTLIEQRAIASDPDAVGEIALAFAQGLAVAGVHGTAKHFPGLGRVRSDTHHFTARLSASAADLDGSDWQPFRTMAAQKGIFLMVGHVVVEALDRDHPASQSKAVVTGLLRDQWGYDGPIVTDDLVMSAVYQHGICRGVVDSLNAGVDLLLVAYDGPQYYRLMDCVGAAYRRGEVDDAMMTASEVRLNRTLP